MKKYKLTDLKGLGKNIWKGVDVQEYVNDLRGKNTCDDCVEVCKATHPRKSCALKTHKYDSTKLGWCRYPYQLGDYCWGYSQFIDGTLVEKGKKITSMKVFCRGCEYYGRKKLTKAQYLKLAEMIRKA